MSFNVVKNTPQALLVIVAVIALSGNVLGFSYSESSQGLPSDGDYSFIALGDLNKDGNTDIVSGSDEYGGSPSPYGLHAWKGDGSGKWSGLSSGLPDDNTYGGIGLGDIDKDGYPDIVAAFETWGGGSGNGVGIWFNNAGTGWTEGGTVGSGGYDSAVLVDMNSDGMLDIVGGSRGAGIKVWFGDGGSAWTESCTGLPTGGEYTGIVVGDPDRDGDMDIAGGNYQGNGVQFWANDGSCVFSEQSDGLHSSDNSFSVVFADMDKDGNDDLLGSVRGKGIFVWLGDGGAGGSMTWTESRSGLPTNDKYKQLAVGDINSDGNLDIAAARPGGGLYVWKGNGGTGGSLTFIDESGDLPTDGTYYGVGLADINGDTALDVIGASWGKGVHAFVTTVGPADTTPPAAIYDLSVQQKDQGSVTLKWTATGDDGRDGTAAKYEIRYSTDGAINDDSKFSAAFDAGATITPKASGQPESYRVTGLSGNTTYHFAVKAIDDGLNSVISNPVEATTDPVPGDSMPPVVSILTPALGEEVKNMVDIRASFSDSDGQVNSVKFYVDDVLLHSQTLEGTETEYTYAWNSWEGIDPGQHTIKVVVTDTAGHSSETRTDVEVLEEPKDCDGCGNSPSPGFETIALVPVFMLVLLFTARKKR